MHSEKLLTTKEVARLLQVSASTLCKWRVSRRESLPFLKLSRAVRYRAEDVNDFLQRRLRHSTSETGPPVAARQ